MKMNFSMGRGLLAASMLTFAMTTVQAIEPVKQIIPKPQQVEVGKGCAFSLTPQTVIYYHPSLKAQAEYL